MKLLELYVVKGRDSHLTILTIFKISEDKKRATHLCSFLLFEFVKCHLFNILHGRAYSKLSVFTRNKRAVYICGSLQNGNLSEEK